MAGIYIHIPYCQQACYYCNFAFSTSRKTLPDMIRAICEEAIDRKVYLQESIDTIYFGGGTPSLVGITFLQQIMQTLQTQYDISKNAEITFEANPDDINRENLLQWKKIGINRLSIGIQSFFDSHLLWMNRSHYASDAIHAIQLVKENGFTNFSIDLIYGIPGLNDAQWIENIDQALTLGIPHISCYALTVEEKTALHKMILQQKKEDVQAKDQQRHFNILLKKMKAAGYRHYEISNFAKKGFYSRHNSSYWENKKYLGLGPSAHSFNGSSRQWNISNNALFIKARKEHLPCFDIEYLTPVQQLNEYIMTSLRTENGIAAEKIIRLSNEQQWRSIFNDAEKWLKAKKIKWQHDHLILTNKGKFFADGIAADLFRTEEK